MSTAVIPEPIAQLQNRLDQFRSTRRIGSERGRRGKRKATKRILGVASQQLRYLELLLLAPWTVERRSPASKCSIVTSFGGSSKRHTSEIS